MEEQAGENAVQAKLGIAPGVSCRSKKLVLDVEIRGEFNNSDAPPPAGHKGLNPCHR
jgi:hypothetical protein